MYCVNIVSIKCNIIVLSVNPNVSQLCIISANVCVCVQCVQWLFLPMPLFYIYSFMETIIRN